jgi:hypothetical protein
MHLEQTQLIKYEAARAALAEARSADEVKDIRDKSEAMRAYARMANDMQLQLDAAELRLRAERRLGQMIRTQKEGGYGLNEGGRPKKTPSNQEEVSRVPSLPEIGIDHKLSSRAQKIAGISDEAFEAAVDRVRERIEARDGRVSLDITAGDKSARSKSGKSATDQVAPAPVAKDGQDPDEAEFLAKADTAIAAAHYSGDLLYESLIEKSREVIRAWQRCLIDLEREWQAAGE